jgi:hypothetical protein
VIGFDIERHDYGTGGYPGQLVLQDVLTLHGSQFRKAAVIVASPPCQAYSHRGMPWGALWREHNRMDDDGGPPGNYRGKDPIFNDLFRACFRIAREAGVPLIVENVKTAQPFVGPAAWHFGSYYLWGDVPALMPFALRRRKSQHTPLVETPDGTGKTSWFFGTSRHEGRFYGEKTSGLMQKRNGHGHGHTRHLTNQREHLKGGNGSWFNQSHGERREGNNAGNPMRGDGAKVSGDWFGSYATMKAAGTISPGRLHGKGSSERAAASAQIAKIPFPLAQHIARVFKPYPVEPSAPELQTAGG